MTKLEVPDLNDAWSDWLVYADWLSEQGDIRGELIVLDSRLAKDPENEELQLEIDGCIEAWLEQAGGKIWEEDQDWFETYVELSRGLRRFGQNVPRELTALLWIPKSRLIATLDASDDLEVPRSPILLQHERKVYDALIHWIEAVFDGVPVPGEGHRTLYQAEAADNFAQCAKSRDDSRSESRARRVREDNYDDCDRSRDHLGRWQDLPEQHLLDCEWAVPFLDRQGLPYYLPAIMCFALRYAFKSPDGWITESLSYNLTPTSGLIDRFEVMTWPQRTAICAYILASGNAEAFEAWIRVVEAEKEGPRDDWFAILTRPG